MQWNRGRNELYASDDGIRREKYEIYTAWKFGSEGIPYLYGVHGVWGCGKRAALLDG